MNTALKAYTIGDAGATFAMAKHGVSFTAIGGRGVDTVYVPDGGEVDATNLGASSDLIYFRGNWGDYTKSAVSAGTTITFTRDIDGMTETVRVTAVNTLAQNDRLIFADGAVLSYNAKVAVLANANAAISDVVGYDLETVTPGIDTTPPALVVTAAGDDNLTTAEATGAGGVISITTETGASVSVLFTGEGGQVTKTLTGTGSAQAVVLNANDLAALGEGAVTISTSARDAAGNTATASTGGFTLDTLAPDLAVATVGDGNLTMAEAAAGVVTVNAEAGAAVSVIFTGTLGQVTNNTTGTGAAQAVTLNAGNLASLGDGAVTVATTATDAAGNITASSDGGFNLDTTAPTYLIDSAQVDGSTLTLTYTELSGLDANNKAAPGDFTVTVTRISDSSVTHPAVTGVAVNGNTVTLTLDAPVAYKSTVTLTYADSSSGTNAIQDSAGNDAAAFSEVVRVSDGNLADGYIRDAHIYIDTTGDGNGDHDTGVFTNASGNFFLPPGTPAGTIIAIGGVNIDTGVANTLVYKAPAGSTTVSPLTTLVQTYADTNSVSATDAETAVQNALGLPAGVDLLTFDPLAAAPDDADALAVQKAAAQIATIAMLAASAPAEGATADAAAQEVIDNLVAGVGAGPVNLSDSGTATGLLGPSTNIANIAPTAVSDATTAIGGAADFSAISNAQSLALDKVAPAAPVALPDLLAASDSGRLSNDDTTNVTTPTVRVRVNTSATDGTAAVAGDTAKLFDGANLVGSGVISADDIANGFIDLTTSTLAHGVHGLTATLTDAAGNVGAASASLSLNIDTVAPTTSLSGIALSADTGGSANDFLTKVAAQTVTAALSAPLVAGEFVYGSTNGGTTWSDITGSVSGTTLTWNTVLRTGANSLQLKVSDTAGNNGAVASQAYTLDITAPTLVVAGVGDSNLSAAEATGAGGVVTVNAETGSGVAVVFTGRSGTVTKTFTGDASAHAVALSAGDLTTLGNGAVGVATTATDAAGNSRFSTVGGFNLDATAPAAPVISAVSTDNMVNAAEKAAGVTVSGTAEAGSSVAVTWGATTKTVTATAGAWTSSFASGEIPADGNTSISASATDAAGNLGAAGTRAVTVDTGAPAAPTVTPADTTVIDHGGSLYINNGQFNVSGLESGATWQYTLNSGTTWLTGVGTSFTLPQGTYGTEVQVRQIDAAGNPGTPDINDGQPVIVDTTAPAAPGLALAADTGASNSDGVTSNGQILVTGLEAGATWQYSSNGGTTWNDGTGTNFTLVPGTYAAGAVKVRQTDIAGNTGNITSTATSLVIDNVAPAAPGLALAVDTGASAVDGITSNGQINVSGLEANATWQYSTNSGASWNTGTGSSFTLAAGSYAAGAVQVKQTDLAGNSGTAGNHAGAISVDATAPVFQSATINASTLVLSYGESLDSAHSATTGSFTVSVNGGARAVNAVAVSGGNVTLTLASAVASTDTVTIAYTDPTAGNDASATQDVAGNDAATLAAQAVTNNTPAGPDLTAPVLQSATVNDGTITLTYNEALDPAHQPAASYFTATVNGLNRAVDNVAIQGNSVMVTLLAGVSQGDTVTVSYNDPSGGDDVYAIQDVAGNDAASLAGRAVTNNTVGNSAITKVVNAGFSESTNATVYFTFNETMQASNPGDLVLLKNGTGANILIGQSIVGGTVTYNTNATLAATDYVVMTYRGGDLRDLSDNYVSNNTLVIGGSGVNNIDLENIDWSNYTSPITIRANGGADVVTGSHNNDTLNGGGGSDTLNGGYGADRYNLSESTRATDTVVVGTDGGTSSGSQVYFHDTVYAFDVSGTTTNDKLNLASGSIATNASHVNGTDVGSLALHSISGGILTFENSGGTAILINAGNLKAATDYLEANITTAGTTLGFAYDSDGNGYADSLFVFQNQGGSDLDNDTLILLAGVNGVTLGNSAGQNVVQIVDTTGPTIVNANFSANALNLYFSETVAGADLTGITLQKGTGTTLTGLTPVGAVVNGTIATVTLSAANLVDTNYVLITPSDRAHQSGTDGFDNTSLLFAADEAGFALGGNGDTVIDISALSGSIGIYDPSGGNDTLIGNNDSNDLEGGPGNDSLSGRGGNDRLNGGTGADTLDGGDGADKFSFTQGDSTPVSYSTGVYTFSGGADIISGGFTTVATNNDPDSGDRVHLRSAMPGNGLSSMSAPVDHLVTDQHYFLERGNYSGGVFTLNAGGADTLVVYDGDSDTGSVSQTALVIQGVNPTQLTATDWGTIYLSSSVANPTEYINIAENTTFVTSDPANTANTTYILGGVDASRFSMSANGVLNFLVAPDFENPTDIGLNNVYDLTVEVRESGVFNDFITLAVSVTDVAEGGNSPIYITGSTFSEYTPVVGTWTLGASPDNAFVTLVLLPDSRFMYMEGSGDEPNGLEAGTYVYNATAGTIAFTVTHDYNSDGGIGPDLSGAALPIAVNNGQLSITFAPGEIGEFDRNAINSSGIAGTWMMPASVNEPFSMLMLYADGRYMYGEGSGEQPNGMESGTYTYNSGVLAFTTTFDNNGDGGVSDNGAPSSFNAALNGAVLELVVDVGAIALSRQYSSTVSISFSDTVTASGAGGVSLSLNPTEANNWNGTQLAITGTSIAGNVVTFTTWGVLTSTDVVRMRYDADPGSLADLSGNQAPSGEVWIGGSGNSVIDLDGYWPQNGFPVALRGNGGSDRLVGTAYNDVLIDGGGADSLTGSWGADIIRLVENGGSIPYSRDVVKIGLGESPATGAPVSNAMGADFDVVTGSSTSPANTGFDIASGDSSKHDVLDLPSKLIAGNVSHADGIDSGTLAKHSISNGIITFETAANAPILINQSNAEAAINYLELNITNRTTVAFKMDTDNNGSVDSLIVFQDSGTVPLAGNFAIPDIAVVLADLIGIAGATLGTTAGANVVQIQDTQAPEPVAMALTGDGMTFNFAENAFVPEAGAPSLALTMQKNGAGAVLSPTTVDGDGSTVMTLHYALELTPEDWVLMHYAGTSTANGIRDANGNAVVEDNTGGFRFAEGGSGNNTINLSTLSAGYEINGYAGNDALIGSSGNDRITGGTGADTLSGGAGKDEFIFEQGDSPLTVFNENGGAGVSNGDTFSFANGVDRITDLSRGEAVDLNKWMSDLLGDYDAPRYMGSTPANGLVTDQGYFVTQGNYAGGVFTANSAGSDTLLVYDGDSSSAVTQTGIVLSGVLPTQLQLGGSYIEVTGFTNNGDTYTLPSPTVIGQTVDALGGSDTLLMPFYPNMIVPDGPGLYFGNVLDPASISTTSIVYTLNNQSATSYHLSGIHDVLAVQPVTDYDLTLNNFEHLRFDDGTHSLDINLASDIGVVHANQAVGGVLNGLDLAASYLFASYEAGPLTGVSQVIGGAVLDTVGLSFAGISEIHMNKDESGANPVWRFNEGASEVFNITQTVGGWSIDYASNGAGADVALSGIEYAAVLNSLNDSVLLRMSFETGQPTIIV